LFSVSALELVLENFNVEIRVAQGLVNLQPHLILLVYFGLKLLKLLSERLDGLRLDLIVIFEHL
jgi:hypothetical protein